MDDTNKKIKAFEQRIRLFLSDGTPKSEQDVIRVWLFKEDGDADMKRDMLCRVMLEQFEAGTGLDAGNVEEAARALGLDGTEDLFTK